MSVTTVRLQNVLSKFEYFFKKKNNTQTALKTEMDRTNWLEGEIPFSLNGLRAHAE